VLDLPAESTTRIPNHRDREATFTVDEADDPLLNTWPFLLIVRTGWIVTVHTTSSHEGVTRMDEYHRILGYSSIWPAALHTSPREGATPSHVRVSLGFPMSPWGKDHIFVSSSEMRGLACGL
jgi:hypothetical protein